MGIFHLGVIGDGVWISGVWSSELQSLELWSSEFGISHLRVLQHGNPRRKRAQGKLKQGQRLDIQHSPSWSGWRQSSDIRSLESPFSEPHKMGYEGGEPGRTQEQGARVQKSSIRSFPASNLST